MVQSQFIRRLIGTRGFAILVVIPAVVLCAVSCERRDDGAQPNFPKKVQQSCRTQAGCSALFRQLSAERNRCYDDYGPDYGTGECKINELHWWALKDHIELIELRRRHGQQACQQQQQEVQKERQQLRTEREQLAQVQQQWREERKRAAQIDTQWREIDPKRCSLLGESEACYQLVRFISLGDNPHLAEAKAALEAGQRLIAQRKKRTGKYDVYVTR
jgi:hypothetical protein